MCHELLGIPTDFYRQAHEGDNIDKGVGSSLDVFSKFADRVSIPVSTCRLAAGTLGGMTDCTGLEERTGSGRPFGRLQSLY